MRIRVLTIHRFQGIGVSYWRGVEKVFKAGGNYIFVASIDHLLHFSQFFMFLSVGSRSLSPPSFRFHLAMDTLVIGYGLPPLGS